MAKKGFLELFFAEYNYTEWIRFFDWLLDDDKFVNWSGIKLRQYVDEYKNLSDVAQGLFIYDKKAVANPSKYDRKRNRARKSIIIMVKGQGQAKDIIRHIRNSIFHGRAVLCTRNSIRCVELTDYGKHGDKNEKGGQTAYMLLPVDLLNKLFKIYERLN